MHYRIHSLCNSVESRLFSAFEIQLHYFQRRVVERLSRFLGVQYRNAHAMPFFKQSGNQMLSHVSSSARNQYFQLKPTLTTIKGNFLKKGWRKRKCLNEKKRAGDVGAWQDLPTGSPSVEKNKRK